jgi:hypothetical protein
MSRPSTRESAAQRGTVRANAVDVGVREYLACSPLLLGIAAAAFDTKVDKPFLPGSAAHKAHRQLRRLRCRMVMPAESSWPLTRRAHWSWVSSSGPGDGVRRSPPR